MYASPYDLVKVRIMVSRRRFGNASRSRVRPQQLLASGISGDTTRRNIRPSFKYNPLHDSEGIWWLALRISLASGNRERRLFRLFSVFSRLFGHFASWPQGNLHGHFYFARIHLFIVISWIIYMNYV